jgi:hypothetical protein
MALVRSLTGCHRSGRDDLVVHTMNNGFALVCRHDEPPQDLNLWPRSTVSPQDQRSVPSVRGLSERRALGRLAANK